LEAYRRAIELANDLHARVMRWTRPDQANIGWQLVRAADSVGANIAEAAGRWHVADKRRILFIARGSLYELEHWMVLAEHRGLLELGTSESVAPVARALSGLIKRPSPDEPPTRTVNRQPPR